MIDPKYLGAKVSLVFLFILKELHVKFTLFYHNFLLGLSSKNLFKFKNKSGPPGPPYRGTRTGSDTQNLEFRKRLIEFYQISSALLG